MLYRTRLALLKTLVATSLTLAVPNLALAQAAPPNASPQAEALNEQGKDLYKNKDYQGAAAKFREANAIQPDGRYYFNLCATLEKAGDLDGALEACDAVYQNAPNDELKGKTGQRAAAIRQSIRERNAANGGGQPPPPPPPGGGTQTPPPGGGTQNPPPGGGGPVNTGGNLQPPGGPEVTKAVPGDYKWAFGAEAGPVLSTSGDAFSGADSGGMLRLYADRSIGGTLGGRLFLGVGALSYNGVAGSGATGTLTIVEFGAAAFTNIKLAPNLWISPALGVELAGMQPSVSSGSGSASGDSFGTFGVTLGLPISYAFGGGRHVVYINPLAVTFYLPSTSTDNNTGISTDFKGGSTFMITFGYQLRIQEGEKLPGFVVLE